MAQLPSELILHSRKVCSLYKRALRCIRDFTIDKADQRYKSALMRDRFDKNQNIRDARLAKILLLNGEEELFQNTHCQPIKFARSVGGVAYQREGEVPDVVLDFWHPEEKAKYPKYFKRREEMKKEYEQLYYKLYPQTPDTSTKKK